MNLVKKIYLLLMILTLAFLFSKCGEHKNKYDRPHESETQTEMPGNDKPAVQTDNTAIGKQYFDQTCAACHGMDAKGLPKLGKDLITSKFVAEKSDAQLLAFVKKGRSVTDPLNTTGVAMPPKGGNTALTDPQILDIISYIRQLRKK